MTDDLTFFHQATVKICGSLDIDRAVGDIVLYLKGFIPLDGIMLCTYEPEKGAIWILSLSSSLPTGPWNRPIYLSPGAQSLINATGSGVYRHLTSDNNPIAHELNAALKMDTASQLVLHLKLDERHLGVVHAFSRAEDVFTAEHARLMGLLHDPFAVAMANVIKHREVLHLKDLLADDNRYLQQELRHMTGDEIIGAHFGLRDVMRMVRQVAPLSSPVMLTGETGVGKEVIANAIHVTSTRREGPLVKVNCGAFAENLLDSELFGHEKGAFTGAVQSKRGRFERAHRGTLFLDEVGELPPAAQVRLLRVLQDKLVERVGGVEPVEVDVRIVAATHRNLTEMVRQGTFREDLLFRLNVFPIHIPPLRQRISDIPALVHHFIERKLKAFNLTRHPTLAAGTLERLTAYPWPGNVRELENMVERALIRHQSRSEDKPLSFPDLVEETGTDQSRAAGVFAGPTAPANLTLDEAMRVHIEGVLRQTRGKIQGKDGAAAMLGIHSSTLRSRMEKLGVAYGRKAKKG